MKKHLLLFCLSLLCVSGIAKAESSTLFGYANESATQLSIGGVTANKTRIYLAYELHSEDVALFSGNSITAITVCSGRGALSTNTKEVEVFITKKLGDEPIVKQTAELEKRGNRDNLITLNTPVEIKENEPLYIGYSFPAPSSGTYIPVDNNPAAESNLIFGVSDTDALPSVWSAVGNDRGSLYCPVTITGNSLPSRLAFVTKIQAPAIAISGTTGTCTVTVTNRGPESITSLEIETKIGDGDPVATTFDRGVYLRTGSWKSFSAEVPFVGEGTLPVVCTVTKINGEDAPRRSAEGSTVVYEHGYDRNLVIEEATGTWCPWCPSGIVMLDYIHQNYGDRYLCIAYHAGDEMQDNTAASFVNSYVSGYPYTITNRVYEQAPGVTVETQRSFVDNTYEEATSVPSYCKLDIDANREGNKLKLKAVAEFAVNVDGGHTLSFALVEDGVGPYTQKNNYAGTGTAMGGWEKKPFEVSHVFDDVLRHFEGTVGTGIKGSLPDNIEKETRYIYECELPMSKVTGENYRVIGMIINTATGEIVNAGLWYPGKESGVSDVVADGADAPVEYFNLHGIRVDNPESGIYIRKQGNKTSKVYVK